MFTFHTKYINQDSRIIPYKYKAVHCVVATVGPVDWLSILEHLEAPKWLWPNNDKSH